MLKITASGNKYNFYIEVRKLDIFNSMKLEKKIFSVPDMEELSIDMKNVDYVSSYFMRVCHQASNFLGPGNVTLLNVGEAVYYSLDLCNFQKIVNIQKDD